MKHANGGSGGPICLRPAARPRRRRKCRRGGLTRGDRAIAAGGRLPQFPHLPLDARPPALLHSFALGGRSRIPSPRRIAAHRAIPQTPGSAARSAPRRHQDRDDWLSANPPVVARPPSGPFAFVVARLPSGGFAFVVAGLQTRAFNLFVLAAECPSSRFCV